MQQESFIAPAIEKRSRGCDRYRWTLHRIWDRGSIVCWIMLNPSMADDVKDDPTLRRCIDFTRAWGYGGLVVVNLYPFRSPSPAECRRWADWENRGPDWYARDKILLHNLPLVLEHAKSADLVIAAWGAAPWAAEFAEHMVEEIQSDIAPYPDIYCIGANADGSPKHPLARGRSRVPNDQKPILWKEA